MARQRDYKAEYARRVARAREAGFTGYTQQRVVRKWMDDQGVPKERRAGVERQAIQGLKRTPGRSTQEKLDRWREDVREANQGNDSDDEWFWYHV